jgi:hypothetical protein
MALSKIHVASHAQEVNMSEQANEVAEIDVNIVDDTPAEDQNRTPLPQNLVEELEKDDLDQYSDKVKKRLGQMKKVWHDERRAKEALAREREQAIEFAKKTFEENKQLKQRLGNGERVFIKEVTRSAETDLGIAKHALEQAYESGDPKAIARAQEGLIDAKNRVDKVSRIKPSIQESDINVETPPQLREPPRPVPTVDYKAEAWKERNSWFGSDTEMTALALGLHEKLVKSGVDPTSDDYYRQVDENMRKRFPEQFEDAHQTENRNKSIPRKVSTVVAPATRSTSSRQVRITASEAAIAKRLGLTPEAYAREKLKLENY